MIGHFERFLEGAKTFVIPNILPNPARGNAEVEKPQEMTDYLFCQHTKKEHHKLLESAVLWWYFYAPWNLKLAILLTQKSGRFRKLWHAFFGDVM